MLGLGGGDWKLEIVSICVYVGSRYYYYDIVSSFG